MKKRVYIAILILTVTAALLSGCSQKKVVSTNTVDTSAQTHQTAPVTAPAQKTTSKQTEKPDEGSPYDKYFAVEGNTVDLGDDTVSGNTPTAVMKIKDLGYVVIALYPQNAPNTVNNFISNIASGKYDGASFSSFDSRLGFIASAGEAGYSLETEKVENPLIKRSRNIVFMNKENKENGNTSGLSFFICLDEDFQRDFDAALYKEYVAIGEIFEGEDIFQRIAAAASGASKELGDSAPVIDKMMIDLNGYAITDTSKIEK